jgi:hypothetical protein
VDRLRHAPRFMEMLRSTTRCIAPPIMTKLADPL